MIVAHHNRFLYNISTVVYKILMLLPFYFSPALLLTRLLLAYIKLKGRIESLVLLQGRLLWSEALCSFLCITGLTGHAQGYLWPRGCGSLCLKDWHLCMLPRTEQHCHRCWWDDGLVGLAVKTMNICMHQIAYTPSGGPAAPHLRPSLPCAQLLRLQFDEQTNQLQGTPSKGNCGNWMATT